LVDSLNIEKLGFQHSIPLELGRPSYDPSDLLKLYVYGYLNQIRSSRKLERECHQNVEVMWLMKKLTPDFKTIADFRKDNVDCVKGVFKEFVKLYMSLDLYGAKLVANDGTKFKTVNSLDRARARNSASPSLANKDSKTSIQLPLYWYIVFRTPSQ
jgi:transposase